MSLSLFSYKRLLGVAESASSSSSFAVLRDATAQVTEFAGDILKGKSWRMMFGQGCYNAFFGMGGIGKANVVHSFLVKCLHHVHGRLHGMRQDKKQTKVFLNGCAVVLQAWLFEHIIYMDNLSLGVKCPNFKEEHVPRIRGEIATTILRSEVTICEDLITDSSRDWP
ncbi:hypothetical protein H6P81_018830 [Aristolochia fimbriata]|uniref:Uncharacterized protein n=1 Tax=Aristolochia fimbriata TaxID=158543 RepID=A0AAV7E543_ARIFI|nr:hypothetical protein H6P81_018830 [Aristolochia fimbriata]